MDLDRWENDQDLDNLCMSVKVEDPSPEKFVQASKGLIQSGLQRMLLESNEIRIKLFATNSAIMELKGKFACAMETRVKTGIAIRTIENTRLNAKTPSEIERAIEQLNEEIRNKRRFYSQVEKAIKKDSLQMNSLGAPELKTLAKSLSVYRLRILHDTTITLNALNRNLAILKKNQRAYVHECIVRNDPKPKKRGTIMKQFGRKGDTSVKEQSKSQS